MHLVYLYVILVVVLGGLAWALALIPGANITATVILLMGVLLFMKENR